MTKTDNQLRADDLKANLKNAVTELDLIGKAKESQLKLIEMAIYEREVRQNMHEAALLKFVNLNPSYEFQKDEEYVKWQKELSTIEQNRKQYELETQIHQMQRNTGKFEQQLESQRKAIEDIKAKLVELGEPNE